MPQRPWQICYRLVLCIHLSALQNIVGVNFNFFSRENTPQQSSDENSVDLVNCKKYLKIFI